MQDSHCRRPAERKLVRKRICTTVHRQEEKRGGRERERDLSNTSTKEREPGIQEQITQKQRSKSSRVQEFKRRQQVKRV
jgi:hypothetical protein